MKTLKFDYGKTGLEIKLDPSWNSIIVKPSIQHILTNPIKSITSAIQNPLGKVPLREIVKMKDKLESVCIVVSDATRPVPSHLILDALINELENNGIKRGIITILIATGLHRPSTDVEIERIIGSKYFNKIKVVNHNAKDKNFSQYIKNLKIDTPIAINKIYMESDLKILTGYVEPHFFFGFSGGAKSIIPGIASEESIMFNHSARNIASHYSRFGVKEQNPMANLSTEIAKSVGVDFTINVCINETHQITKVAAGDLNKVHKKLVSYQLEHIFKEIKEQFDIVVCGNGGYPLDLNLYQAVKSMAMGEIAVKQGGTIITVNECSDGIGIGQDEFKELLFSGMNPKDIYNKILSGEITLPDQWEMQVLTRVMKKADVYVISQLKEKELGNIGLKYANKIETVIHHVVKVHGNDTRILFLPNGPQVLPKVI